MRPLIRDGDMLGVSPYPQTPIGVGDIVLFHRDALLVAHRIIAMKTENGETLVAERGDNAGTIVWRPARDILGRVDRVQGPRRSLELNGAAARFVSRVMNLYWRVIGRTGRLKSLLIRILEGLLHFLGR